MTDIYWVDARHSWPNSTATTNATGDRNMGFKQYYLLPGLCVISLLCARSAIAQDGQPPREAGGAADTQESIDEITVVAPRSLVAIKRQMERADKVLFEIANTLIDDPLYKVHCRRESRAGTNLKQRVCKPGFEDELLSEIWEEERAMQRMGEGSFSFNYALPEAEMRKHREKQKQIMIELAAENPELSAAIYLRAKLQRDYNNERERRRQKEE